MRLPLMLGSILFFLFFPLLLLLCRVKTKTSRRPPKAALSGHITMHITLHIKRSCPNTIHINKGVWGPSRIRGSGSLVSPPGLHAGTLSPIDVSFILYWLPAPADAARFAACGYAGFLAEVSLLMWKDRFLECNFLRKAKPFGENAFRGPISLHTLAQEAVPTGAAWGVTPPRQLVSSNVLEPNLQTWGKAALLRLFPDLGSGCALERPPRDFQEPNP